MAARSIGSATLVIRLARVPVRLFTAQSRKRPSFKMLHRCGSTLAQELRCRTEGTVVERKDAVRAFEYEPDRFVQFTDEELKAIELASEPDIIRIEEFVPEASVEPLHLDGAVYLGPDKGCERAYRVIAQALERRRLAGVGLFGTKGLVVVRHVDQGLALHECLFADEVRRIGDEILPEPVTAPRREVVAAERLFAAMTKEDFGPHRFANVYAAKVAESVERKVAGKEILVPPPARAEEALDLVEALERSLAAPAKAPSPKRRGKAA